MRDLSDKAWLEQLLQEELLAYDPAAAKGRLPAEVRAASGSSDDLVAAGRLLVARSLRHRRLVDDLSPEDAFRLQVREHVALALDLALVRGEPFVRTRVRAELAAFLAAAVGEHAVALAVEPEQPGGVTERAVERALRAAGEALRDRFYPPGDPLHGLPLYPGAAAVLRHRLARVVIGYHRSGRLVRDALARHAAFATKASLLLAEALSGLLLAAGPADEHARSIRLRQLGRLGLDRADLREARRRVETPRPPAALAAAAPENVRPFLLEQLFLGQLRARLTDPGSAGYLEAFIAACDCEPGTVAAVRVEAAAQHGDHQAWFEAFGETGVPVDLQKLADEWEEVADHVVERVATAVSDNVGAMVTELRETGELGTLLAKAAGGHTLTGEEKRKVKSQLIDLAKAVPALAIFAAPGGMLLLPLLAKLLPFNLLPSAWDRSRPAAAGAEPGLPALPAADPPPAPPSPTARGEAGSRGEARPRSPRR